jgi:hypothetical protein
MRYPRRYFEAAHEVVSELTTVPASRSKVAIGG